MKGRFRKGKKAYRMALRSPRQANFERRYQRWLIRTERHKKASIQCVQASLWAAYGALGVAKIRADINRTPQERAIAIAQQVIHTAQGIAKVFTE